MDMISLYYFSELARELHMTRTASRLFISQQTLSNHIQRLEEYYGTPLLHRKPALSLTTAGELVLACADRINHEHINLKDILSDVAQQERGVLRFGASAIRLNICLPAVLPPFSARYPNVYIRITDTVTSRLEPLVLNRSIDFAIILNGTEQPRLITQQLMDDQVYLCVADSLLRACYGERAGELKEKAVHGAYVEDFSTLPFCIFDNHMGRQIGQCFDAALWIAACRRTPLKKFSAKEFLPFLTSKPQYAILKEQHILKLKSAYYPLFRVMEIQRICEVTATPFKPGDRRCPGGEERKVPA